MSKNIKTEIANWTFDKKTYLDFDKHILKSIPLYAETNNLFTFLSDFFLQKDSRVIDIGCSTGSFLLKIAERHKNNNKNLTYEGYDEVHNMIKYSKNKNKKKNLNVKFIKKDILKLNFKNSCIVSSFYTIQFIEQKYRQQLINSIFKGLNWGGAFFFVEKVRGSDARFQDILNQIYIDFKLNSGFKADEIVNKSISLKGVMEPFSENGNLSMLKRAGFIDINTVFKYGPFQGFLCIK